MRNLIPFNILVLLYDRNIWKILFLTISLVVVAGQTTQAQERAFVMSSFPRSGATGLDCTPIISLKFHFPFESRTLDPLTIHDGNIRLYHAESNEEAERVDMSFNHETGTLSLIPRKRLIPNSSYILSITPGLIDDRGFSLRPFFVKFQTGGCGFAEQLVATRGVEKSPVLPPGPHVLLRSDTLTAMEEVNRIKWEAFRERMIANYIITRKTDTSDFRRVASIVCPGDNDSLQEYMWVDPIPSDGWNHYQISAITIMGDTLILDTISHFRKLVAFPNTDAIWQGRLPVVSWLAERTPMVAIVKDLDRNIVRKEAGWAEAGQKFWTVELGVLDPGEYHVQIFLGKESFSTDILVTE